jgi:hypothetical protein
LTVMVHSSGVHTPYMRPLARRSELSGTGGALPERNRT